MRYARLPLTLAELFQPGPPIRVRDLCAITGWPRIRIHRALECGDLVSLAHHARAMVYITRQEARRWLLACGFDVPREVCPTCSTRLHESGAH